MHQFRSGSPAGLVTLLALFSAAPPKTLSLLSPSASHPAVTLIPGPSLFVSSNLCLPEILACFTARRCLRTATARLHEEHPRLVWACFYSEPPKMPRENERYKPDGHQWLSPSRCSVYESEKTTERRKKYFSSFFCEFSLPERFIRRSHHLTSVTYHQL